MNHIMNNLLTTLNSVGEVFCRHAVGVFVQSALLVIVLYALDLLLRRRVRAVFRYCVWLLVLVKLVLPPTLSLPTGVGYWAGDHLPSALSVSGRPFDGPGLEYMGMSGERPHARLSEDIAEGDPLVAATNAPLPALTWRAILFILWLVGVAAFLALLAQRARFVRALIAASNPAKKEHVELLEECRRLIGVRLNSRLSISEAIPSPAVCGFFRPTIVIPAALVDKLSPEGLRAILIHELAHIKRGDLWINSIQTFLQIVYFYNPFVWFANSVIRRVCEEAVDETVLVTLGGQARNYSNTLIDIGEMTFWKADLGLRLVGVAESRKALQWRIKHMLTRPIPKNSKLGVIGVATVICIAAILLPMSKAEKVKPATETVKTDVAPTFVKMWPEVPAWLCFHNPSDPAVDSSGNIYVADWNGRIVKFTPEGVLIAKWGSKGSGDSEFEWPWGIALDASGNVYVADTGNHRIQKFTPDGKFITKWGSKGSGDGEFDRPWRIALDASGNVYVADTGNHRIQKFTPDGGFIAKWGSEGSGEGQFRHPSCVAVDNDGNIYVGEAGNNRIQKFTSDGKFITKWGSTGNGEGEFSLPLSVAVDRSGNVYVLERRNTRVQKFTSDGKFIATWGPQGPADGQLRYRGMSLDNSDNVYLVDRASIQMFTSDGGFITKWGSSGSGDGEFTGPIGVAVDSSGNIYVAEAGNHRIQKFASDGGFIAKWGSQGSGDGEFNGPIGVAVGNSGNVYVADAGNHCIQKFTSDGKFITKWGSKGSDEGQFGYPWGMAVDASGNVYVADNGNHCIQKFTSDGKFITKWGSEGSGDGEFKGPSDVAVDRYGNVYVLEGPNTRIQKFTSDGKFIAKWGSKGSGEGEFNRSTGIAVDRSGNVYVADSLNYRIQKFTSDGHFIVKWGSAGSDEGQFSDYIRVAVDDSGNVYVADIGNNRIQKFQPSP